MNTEETLVVDLREENLSMTQLESLLVQIIEAEGYAVTKDTRGINVAYRIAKKD